MDTMEAVAVSFDRDAVRRFMGVPPVITLFLRPSGLVLVVGLVSLGSSRY
jgi:hypothetical protein